jgi:hypothetical protein
MSASVILKEEEEVVECKEEIVSSSEGPSPRSSGHKEELGTTLKKERVSRRREHVKVEYESTSVHKGPVKWQDTYSLIQKQRERAIAPVDSMGCSELTDGDAPEVVKRFQVLVSLMLSSQTRDEVSS